MFAHCMCLVEANTTTKINCNFNNFFCNYQLPVWWYYWARLSQTKISRCNSVTNTDVSHTYYKCELRPNQNAHIKCFEPNTHIHMHSFKLTPNAAHKICRVSDSTIFDLTFKTGSINQYFVLNIYDVQKWTAFVGWFKCTIFWLKHYHWKILWSKIY